VCAVRTGTQGLIYPGGSLQFIVHSEEVQKVKSKKLKERESFRNA